MDTRPAPPTCSQGEAMRALLGAVQATLQGRCRLHCRGAAGYTAGALQATLQGRCRMNARRASTCAQREVELCCFAGSLEDARQRSQLCVKRHALHHTAGAAAAAAAASTAAGSVQQHRLTACSGAAAWAAPKDDEGFVEAAGGRRRTCSNMARVRRAGRSCATRLGHDVTSQYMCACRGGTGRLKASRKSPQPPLR